MRCRPQNWVISVVLKNDSPVAAWRSFRRIAFVTTSVVTAAIHWGGVRGVLLADRLHHAAKVTATPIEIVSWSDASGVGGGPPWGRWVPLVVPHALCGKKNRTD
jgi:hypothetical protein